MLNQAVVPAAAHSWLPSSVWRRAAFLEQRQLSPCSGEFLDIVPVMSATVLGLEMLLDEPCIDLRRVSDLILSDVGATIQILRLVGREFEGASEHPSRMGDCLASLDASTWFEAISAHTFAGEPEHAAITALWNHSRLVAQYAQLVAESMEGVSPEDAYLIGLLHEIEDIPGVLGWVHGVRKSAASLSMEGSLPFFVLSALRSMHEGVNSSPWRFILSEAHKLAGARKECPVSPISH